MGVIDLRSAWQIAQAERCGCRGSDEMCGCQNVDEPWKYGLGPRPPTLDAKIEACIADIKAGLCCPRVHGCEQNDSEYCLVRQAFARTGLIPDLTA